MKGVILAFSIFVLSMVVYVCFIFFVKFDTARSTTSTALKTSLYYTMQEAILEEDRTIITMESLMDMFTDSISEKLISENTYSIRLTGFNLEPLLMQVRINVQSKSRLFGYNFDVEEIMVEVEK